MDDKKKRNNERQQQEKALLTFLTQVKKGEYAKVEESSLRYSRLKEQREESSYEEDYYYSIT
ncbi:MAG: hypothetical protein HZA74_09595 [Ignavibacteriales bacterium]|nr:hypothetical protein [Ignavibacteriales bacterium]